MRKTVTQFQLDAEHINTNDTKKVAYNNPQQPCLVWINRFFLKVYGRRGAHSYYGNIGKQFPRSPSSTNGATLAFIQRRVPWLTVRRRATSSFWRLTTHLKHVHLSTQTPFISSLPNFAIRCWAIGCFAAAAYRRKMRAQSANFRGIRSCKAAEVRESPTF